MLSDKNPFSETFDTENDKKLVSKALKGDRKALNSLLEAHNSFVYNVSLKMVGNVQDAEDITQNILIKITTNLSSYDPEKAQFRTWLYRIVINHILDLKKS